MPLLLRCALLAGLFSVLLAGTLQAKEPDRGRAIRLHYPIISEADNIEELRPVAATPNIPVYEDSSHRRFLVGVDFAPFLHAWLESHLIRSGFSLQPPGLSGSGTATPAPGLLLELHDFRVELSAAEISYSGSLTIVPPAGAPKRHPFNSMRVMIDCEEGRLEPYRLISHDFSKLLASVRNQLLEDLVTQMATVDALLPGSRIGAGSTR